MIGKIIDSAMLTIEKENPRRKGILNKDYGRERIKKVRLGELIDIIATIGFNDTEHKAKEVLGHVYEYFIKRVGLIPRSLLRDIAKVAGC